MILFAQVKLNKKDIAAANILSVSLQDIYDELVI